MIDNDAEWYLPRLKKREMPRLLQPNHSKSSYWHDDIGSSRN